MEYRLNKQDLFTYLQDWNEYLNKKVHLIACGGTALTILDLKSSTKDIDFIVPVESEYDYLIGILKDLGYKSQTGSGWSRGDQYIFDLFRGKRVHTTELLESPLETGNNIAVKEFSHIYLGVLNFYDLIISKLFRASGADIDDCLSLIKAKKNEIDLDLLENKFKETASYDVSEKNVLKNLEYFLKVVRKEKIYGK